MRKISCTTAALACLLFYACSNELSTPSLSTDNGSTLSDFRSLEEAVEIANKSVSMLGDGTRSTTDRVVDSKKIYAVKNHSTRTSSENTFNHDTLMYAINFEDGNGYAIVSANRATEALIAITESGSYSPDEPSDNEGLNYYMENAAKYVSVSSLQPLPYIKERDTIASRLRSGFPLDTKWGQKNYFGRFAPNNICGCFPLAVMEIMSYYSYPSTMTLHYPGGNDSIISINWTDIYKHKVYNAIRVHDLDCEASSEAHTNISHIAREIGYEAECIYGTNSTGTYRSKELPCVIGLGFTNAEMKDYEPGCTTSYLSQGHPLIFVGSSEDGGHAWVVDACIREHLTITDRSGLKIGESARTYEVDNIYNHYNWGWDGIDNGYYLDNVFDVSEYSELDDTKYKNDNIDYNFNQNNQYLIMWP